VPIRVELTTLPKETGLKATEVIGVRRSMVVGLFLLLLLGLAAPVSTAGETDPPVDG
jgi:hypothetical protein